MTDAQNDNASGASLSNEGLGVNDLSVVVFAVAVWAKSNRVFH